MQIGIYLPVGEMQNDLAAIREFAQTAEELGFTHLRIADLVTRPNAGHRHEALTLLAWIAGFTERIELVPAVINMPARQTVLLAKQAVEIDLLSGGRLRFGVGVGSRPEEYQALGQDFTTRGRRADEQIELLRALWENETVDFNGRWDTVAGLGINPRPGRRIPIWVGHAIVRDGGRIAPSVLRRIVRNDGWFPALSRPQLPEILAEIRRLAESEGRDPGQIGTEGVLRVAGQNAAEWLAELAAWESDGATHMSLNTLGAGLGSSGHLALLKEAARAIGQR